MAPKWKPAELLGGVVRNGWGWRVRVWLGGRNYVGPTRQTEYEASADLAAMRGLPRDEMGPFLERMRSEENHDIVVVDRQAALNDAFQQTACPDVVSGSPANLPKHTLVLEPSGTPACKKGRSADEESVGPADAARPSSSVEALQTPQCILSPWRPWIARVTPLPE